MSYSAKAPPIKPDWSVTLVDTWRDSAKQPWSAVRSAHEEIADNGVCVVIFGSQAPTWDADVRELKLKSHIPDGKITELKHSFGEGETAGGLKTCADDFKEKVCVTNRPLWLLKKPKVRSIHVIKLPRDDLCEVFLEQLNRMANRAQEKQGAGLKLKVCLYVMKGKPDFTLPLRNWMTKSWMSDRVPRGLTREQSDASANEAVVNPNDDFKPRSEPEAFKPRQEVESFKPRQEVESFKPRKEADSFKPRKEADSFKPRFQGAEENVENDFKDARELLSKKNPKQVKDLRGTLSGNKQQDLRGHLSGKNQKRTKNGGDDRLAKMRQQDEQLFRQFFPFDKVLQPPPCFAVMTKLLPDRRELLAVAREYNALFHRGAPDVIDLSQPPLVDNRACRNSRLMQEVIPAYIFARLFGVPEDMEDDPRFARPQPQPFMNRQPQQQHFMMPQQQQQFFVAHDPPPMHMTGPTGPPRAGNFGPNPGMFPGNNFNQDFDRQYEGGGISEARAILANRAGRSQHENFMGNNSGMMMGRNQFGGGDYGRQGQYGGPNFNNRPAPPLFGDGGGEPRRPAPLFGEGSGGGDFAPRGILKSGSGAPPSSVFSSARLEPSSSHMKQSRQSVVVTVKDDENFAPRSNNAPPPPQSIKPDTLAGHFHEYARRKGLNKAYGGDMMLAWRVCGHSEATLTRVVAGLDPGCSKNKLRMALMSEVYSSGSVDDIPSEVNVNEVLDETAAYFMPEPGRIQFNQKMLAESLAGEKRSRRKSPSPMALSDSPPPPPKRQSLEPKGNFSSNVGNGAGFDQGMTSSMPGAVRGFSDSFADAVSGGQQQRNKSDGLLPTPVPQQSFAPRGQDFAPRGQDFAPRGQDFASRGQDFAPRGQDFAPRGQDFAPRDRQEIAPRGQQEFAPRDRQEFAPRGQEIPPREPEFAPRRLPSPVRSSRDYNNQQPKPFFPNPVSSYASSNGRQQQQQPKWTRSFAGDPELLLDGGKVSLEDAQFHWSPLSSFAGERLVRRMRTTRAELPTVTAVVQRLLSHTKLDRGALERLLRAQGAGVARTAVKDNLEPYKSALEAMQGGLTTDFVVQLVVDFLAGEMP